LREIHDTADSRVFRVLAVRDPQALELVVKEHRTREGESAPADVRAAREAGFLDEMARRATADGDVRLTVPELVEQRANVVVMHAARGIRLDAIVRAGRCRDPESLDAALARTAAWLRWFHAPQADGSVLIHGDFWPGNIFIAPDQVTAIDFEGVRAGDPLYDVAWFLVHLGMFFPPPFGARFRRARQRFLISYFDGEIPQASLARHEHDIAARVRERLTKTGVRGSLARLALARHHAGAAA
jgi:hypothetical protein